MLFQILFKRVKSPGCCYSSKSFCSCSSSFSSSIVLSFLKKKINWFYSFLLPFQSLSLPFHSFEVRSDEPGTKRVQLWSSVGLRSHSLEWGNKWWSQRLSYTGYVQANKCIDNGHWFLTVREEIYKYGTSEGRLTDWHLWCWVGLAGIDTNFWFWIDRKNI